MAISPRAWPIMQRDGRVSGLDALLVSRKRPAAVRVLRRRRGGKLGRAARQGQVRPDGAARSALGDQEPGRHALWHRAGRRQGAAAGSEALRSVPGVCRPRKPAGPRPHHHRPRAQHDHGPRMGRAQPSLRRSAQQRERDGGGVRSLSLHPVSPDRRGAGREMDLLRRRNGAARSPDRQGYRARSSRTMRGACCSIRWGWGLSNGPPMPSGEPHAASGGRMRPPDLLRVGQMVLANGAWQGKQIVPADWLKRSTTPAVTIEGTRRYGWQWYLGELPVGTPRHAEPTISAIGWGGQRLFLVPALDLAVAMNCRQLPPADHGAGPHRHHADPRPGAAGTVIELPDRGPPGPLFIPGAPLQCPWRAPSKERAWRPAVRHEC